MKLIDNKFYEMGGLADEDQGLKTIIEDSKLGVTDMSIDPNPKDVYEIRAQYNSGKKDRKRRSDRLGGG